MKLLLHTGVTRYLEFKSVGGSYVYKGTAESGKICKVPSNEREALTSGTNKLAPNIFVDLMGMFEKRRFRKMVIFTDTVDASKPQTWGDIPLNKCSMKAVFDKFGVDNNTQVGAKLTPLTPTKRESFFFIFSYILRISWATLSACIEVMITRSVD